MLVVKENSRLQVGESASNEGCLNNEECLSKAECANGSCCSSNGYCKKTGNPCKNCLDTLQKKEADKTTNLKIHGLQKNTTAKKAIALAGNPNCGKTTAFNQYTGARQHVGNYPGVTVEKKEGYARLNQQEVLLVDLPGIYSLSAYSQEEIIARTVLAPDLQQQKPGAVINIVDASTLERNLLLSVQIMEMGLPIVLACNMMDEARQSGLTIDVDTLAKKLGVPVVPTVAKTGEGLPLALQAAIDLSQEYSQKFFDLQISYGSDLDPLLQSIVKILDNTTELNTLCNRYPTRWLALKVLENDSEIMAYLKLLPPTKHEAITSLCTTIRQHLQKTLDTTPEEMISDYRYGFVRSLLHEGVLFKDNTRSRLALSDAIDKVLTNTLLGPLIMLGIMYTMFVLTFELGAHPQAWVEDSFTFLSAILSKLLTEGLFKSLVIDGVIAGVGGVVSFVPLIMLMFLFIAFLEDSGYMARMAYMLDRVFRIFGLHGCSVMPFIVSGGIAGGCAIPGAMATRTLHSPKEKLATLLTLPYMACGAKLPVFLLLVGIFFPDNAATTMFLLTLSGWVAALTISKLLRSTIIKGESTPFIMELPPYRLPSLRSLVIHCWERTWLYLKKAGTVLVAMSVLLWASMTFPQLTPQQEAPYLTEISQLEVQIEQLAASPEQNNTLLNQLEGQLTTTQAVLAQAALRYSAAGRLGTMLEPFTLAAGFDWRTDIALIGGIVAKEAIVSTLGTAYSLGEQDPEEATDLAEQISKDPGWSKATALAVMLFVLLYSPCFVALVVIRQEAGSWWWFTFSVVFNTGLAYGVAVLAYKLGNIFWS